MSNIKHDRVALRNNLVYIDDVRQVDGWVLLEEFRLSLLEPLISVFAGVELLSVWQLAVLQKESDSFSLSSDVPIAESIWFGLHLDQRFLQSK